MGFSNYLYEGLQQSRKRAADVMKWQLSVGADPYYAVANYAVAVARSISDYSDLYVNETIRSVAWGEGERRIPDFDIDIFYRVMSELWEQELRYQAWQDSIRMKA